MMSTGKRLAKRSIVGTRVCAPGEDGKLYSGTIQAVKTPASFVESNNCINITPFTRYSVKFDSRQGTLGRTTIEFFEKDLIGPGFRSQVGLELVPNQKCYVTYNGREVTGEVCMHHVERDEIIIRIHPPGSEDPFEVQKKMDEVRLLESRKSPRLADQDQDFARLADVGSDRKRTASQTIDVPTSLSSSVQNGSRKRRPSNSQDDNNNKDPQMDECSAALVLMSLSCSPHSPKLNAYKWLAEPAIFEHPIYEERFYELPPPSPPGNDSSSSASSRSSPSPPPRENSPHSGVSLGSSSTSDEGIFMDYLEETPRKKKGRMMFQCTWPSCLTHAQTCEGIEAHVRNDHLNDRVVHAGEEEFYYTEVEFNVLSPAPTLSHRDMAKPPHEDPDYQRQLIGNMRQTMYSGPMPIPQSPHKLLKLTPSVRPHSPKMGPASPVHRRIRGENKKCRKVYGMDHKEQWCTQCKWKKACSRFGD